jgi:hypothetical protein
MRSSSTKRAIIDQRRSVSSHIGSFSVDIKKMCEFCDDLGFAATPEESNKLHHMANFEEWLDRSKHVHKSS